MNALDLGRDEALDVRPNWREEATPRAVSFACSLMSSRQNVSPRRLVEPGPADAEIETMLDMAATAPDHGLLTPWHFVLIPKHRRSLLADAFAQALIARDPGATQAQIEAASDKAYRAPCLLLAIVHLGAAESGIPACERLVSLGCAIQNLLLTATSMRYGCGLTSGRSLESEPIRKLFALTPSEQAVCFVAIGATSQHKPVRQRPTSASIMRVLGA